MNRGGNEHEPGQCRCSTAQHDVGVVPASRIFGPRHTPSFRSLRQAAARTVERGAVPLAFYSESALPLATAETMAGESPANLVQVEPQTPPSKARVPHPCAPESPRPWDPRRGALFECFQIRDERVELIVRDDAAPVRHAHDWCPADDAAGLDHVGNFFLGVELGAERDARQRWD